MSGKKIEGYIDYNGYRNHLRFFNKRGDEFNYTHLDVTGFEFTDDHTGTKRSYVSSYIEFADDTELTDTYFVEVIFEHPDFKLVN